MKAGVCPDCRRWRIAIRLPQCRCLTGPRHRPMSTCPRPVFTDWFCREHACGARLPALHVTDVDQIPHRPPTARTA